MSLVRLARRRTFSCRHFYKVDGWTDEANKNVFGACFHPEGHGHNYTLEAFIEGAPDPVTGMIVNLVDVDRWLIDCVRDLDGKHLNRDVAFFAERVPTTENLSLFLFDRLAPVVREKGLKLAKLRLYEYEDLWVDVWP